MNNRPLVRRLRSYFRLTFVRYGIMAVAVVGIEIGTFWILDSVFGLHYLFATWLSLCIGIVLNWVGSRYYVFGSSKYSKRKEFSLVLFTSLAGVALQSAVVVLTVELLHESSMLGKVLAILVTFFWNYTIRRRFIYKSTENL